MKLVLLLFPLKLSFVHWYFSKSSPCPHSCSPFPVLPVKHTRVCVLQGPKLCRALTSLVGTLRAAGTPPGRWPVACRVLVSKLPVQAPGENTFAEVRTLTVAGVAVSVSPSFLRSQGNQWSSTELCRGWGCMTPSGAGVFIHVECPPESVCFNHLLFTR